MLSLLRPAMASRGAVLAGYWADCPYEYSAGTLDPLPGGKDGFEKLAAAVRRRNPPLTSWSSAMLGGVGL